MQTVLSLILEDRDKIFILQDIIILVLFLKTLMINNVFLTAFNEKHPVISVYCRMCAIFTFSH